MIPRFGYVVRETPDDLYAIFRVNALGVILGKPVAIYGKEHVAQRVSAAMNLEREFEVPS